MIIGKIAEKDIKYIGELQPDGWPSIIPVFDYYINRPFCYPVKVIIENRIVGIGSGISLGKTSWLAHIIVKLEFRNKGIGTIIVNHLCNYLKENGSETISLIASDLGFPIYKKAGFVEQTEYVFYEKPESQSNYFSKNIFMFSNENMDEVFFLDKKISGEDRSGIIKDKLNNSYIYKKNDKITGCYFTELGEGLIIADDIEAGIELMKLRYSKINKGALPINNSNGIDFLKKNGFVEIKRAKRMILGKKFKWHPDKLFNRIAGNLG